MPTSIAPLLAVHISANVLTAPWLVGGFAGMAILIWFGTRGMRDDEIPRIALLTAVFFVASQMHIRIGPTTVHLLLNGLVGLCLGRRACLAIPVGLLLQAMLLSHGDLSTWGVNACIIILPALLAGPLLRLGHDRRPGGFGEAFLAASYILFPWSVVVLGPLVVALRRVERALDLAEGFRAGFVVGAGTVTLTVLLQAVVLVTAGSEDWRAIAVLSVAAHVPVAIIEGVIVGFAANFLLRVRPELLLPAGRPAFILKPLAERAAPEIRRAEIAP